MHTSTIRTLSERDITDNQLFLISAMSKYTVLVSISIITSFGFWILIIIRSIIAATGGTRNDDLPVQITSFNYAAFDVLINMICFMAQFRFFGMKEYYKYCNFIDNKCKNLVKQKTIDYMVKEMTAREQSPELVPEITPNIPNLVSTKSHQNNQSIELDGV